MKLRGPSRGFVLMLAVATVAFTARPSFAAFNDTACQPNPYRGRVKTVSYMEGQVDPSTGAPLGKPSTRYQTSVTRDGRTVTEVSSDVDDARQAQLGMFPRTIREYDAAGRLIKQTLKMNGFTVYTTTDCEYDAKGRLVQATTKSKNPEFNRTLTYKYGPSWRSEQLLTSVASILTTIALDSSGRPVKETRFDERRSVELSVTDYRQVPEGIEACSRVDDGRRRCRVSVYDAHGNMIEQRSEIGTHTAVYEYDAAGNWIKRVTTGVGASNDAVWRQITYW